MAQLSQLTDEEVTLIIEAVALRVDVCEEALSHCATPEQVFLARQTKQTWEDLLEKLEA